MSDEPAVQLPPPLCTVVIPVYNKASTVARTIASVKKQHLNNIEVVLVDDGSIDGSRQAILDAIQNDARFRYVYQENCGVANARNFGISLATSPFVCCIDSDDEIKPTFLETCVRALQADNSLAIAYTKIDVVAPDGRRTVPDWPGEYRFDDFLEGKNPVPTCCVFRRVFWERVGGYRQRYADSKVGAGAEDAELWLRIGAAGGKGELVTQEPLFVYYLGGSVSSNPDYREVDWRSDKNWIHDKRHPFASLASPANGLSHPVRQYDIPTVSVIVPVGPGHSRYLIDLLDSLEGQFFRLWEAVVVDNTRDDQEHEAIQDLLVAYPFVRLVICNTPGAGAARNMGANVARSPLILFLDADDWLGPNALEVLVAAQHDYPGEVIYSDYYGYALIEDDKELARLKRADRLAHHDPETRRTVIRYHAAEYDCEQALRQPDVGGKFYIWNIVSSLVPKQHFLDVGGFDESMESWEDWDLWLRMARAGICFARVPEPLIHYRFYSGKRRALANPGESGESGRQLSTKLLEYMSEKYRKDDAMPGCRSCGGSKRSSSPPPSPMMAMNLNEGRVAKMTSGDLVEVELIDGNIGEHLIAFSQVNYGYRKHGERFKMQAAHAQLDRRVRIIEQQQLVTEKAAVPLQTPRKAQTPLPPPSGSDEEMEPVTVTQPAVAAEKPEKQTVIKSNAYHFQKLWGIDAEKEQALIEAGIRSLNGLQMTSPSRLASILGIDEVHAKNILTRAESAKK